MSNVTQCPKCRTRFKVNEAQLAAHEGLVRCGHCHDIFDASKHLHDDEPSRQLSLPIDHEYPPQEIDLTPIPEIPKLEAEPKTLAQQVRFVEELTDEVLEAKTRKTSWVGVFFALMLTLSLMAQCAYFFRVELGARLPGLKPLLTDYCGLLECTVELPRNIDLIVIDSSELESAPDQSNLVSLHVLIHNRAPFAQAHPSLELTLTNFQDQPIVRRIFNPADYLSPGEDPKLGVPANRDLDIRLRMDTTDLKPSGYRLYLFYPK